LTLSLLLAADKSHVRYNSSLRTPRQSVPRPPTSSIACMFTGRRRGGLYWARATLQTTYTVAPGNRTDRSILQGCASAASRYSYMPVSLLGVQLLSVVPHRYNGSSFAPAAVGNHPGHSRALARRQFRAVTRPRRCL